MRIAIVNDVPVSAEVLRRVVQLRKQHEVVWTARDGVEAVELCATDTPDLILMDLIMPKMDGVQATREIMAKTPCAILVVTCSVNENAKLVFEAMGAGALDAVDTPALGLDNLETVSAPLLAKIDSMDRLLGGGANGKSGTGWQGRSEAPLVAIGASAGGPSALAHVLGNLPKDFPSPIVIIQHVDELFAPSLVSWLRQHSKLPVKAADDGDVPLPGQVLMAARGDHLVFSCPRRLAYTAYPQDVFYRPSVDVFFDSIVRRWAGRVVGVVLTGMGSDGARGLKQLRDAGHPTIAQDKASCAVYGMPKAAAELGAAAQVLALDAIAPALRKLCVSPK